MGVKGLVKFLQTETRVFSFVPLSRYRHRSIAIDAGFLYSRNLVNNERILSSIDIETLLEEDWQLSVSKCLPGLMNHLLLFLSNFLSAQVLPVVVFDGASPVEKLDTRKKRDTLIQGYREIVDDIRKKYKKKGKIDNESATTLRKTLAKAFHIKKEHFALIKQCLDVLKIPYIQSNEEAERLCAGLRREKICRAAYSADSDMIPHMCRLWISDIQTSDKTLGPIAKICRPIKLSSRLKMKPKQLVDFSIMCGCDYNENVKNFGPAKNFKLIKSKKTAEKCFDKEQIKPLNLKACRKLFEPKPVIEMINVEQSNFIGVDLDKIQILNVFESAVDCSKVLEVVKKISPTSLERFKASREKAESLWLLKSSQ